MRIVDGNLRIGLAEGGEIELKGGQLAVLAGRVEEGKTAFALSLAAAANSWGRYPVFYCCGCAEDDRWLTTIDPFIDPACACDILYDNEHALDDVDIPLCFSDTAFGLVDRICAACRKSRGAAGEKTKLIVVDDLSRIRSGSRPRSGTQKPASLESFRASHRELVEDAMRKLKKLAQTLDAAVLLLSDCGGRYDQPGRAPLLSDISETVAKGADMVWILDRDLTAPEGHRLKPPADIKGRPATVHVLKSADGRTGTFSLQWIPRSVSFLFDPPNVHNPEFAPLRHWNELRSWRQQLEKRRLQRATRRAREAQDAAKTYSTPQELWDELGV